MKKQALKILDDRIHHLSMHNEEGKSIRIDEIKILKGILKDRLSNK